MTPIRSRYVGGAETALVARASAWLSRAFPVSTFGRIGAERSFS